jgi:hypothetical protein
VVGLVVFCGGSVLMMPNFAHPERSHEWLSVQEVVLATLVVGPLTGVLLVAWCRSRRR